MTPKEIFSLFVSKAPSDPDIISYFDMIMGVFFCENRTKVVGVSDDPHVPVYRFHFENETDWLWYRPSPDNLPCFGHPMRTAAEIMAYYRKDDPRYAVKP